MTPIAKITLTIGAALATLAVACASSKSPAAASDSGVPGFFGTQAPAPAPAPPAVPRDEACRAVDLNGDGLIGAEDFELLVSRPHTLAQLDAWQHYFGQKCH